MLHGGHLDTISFYQALVSFLIQEGICPVMHRVLTIGYQSSQWHVGFLLKRGIWLLLGLLLVVGFWVWQVPPVVAANVLPSVNISVGEASNPAQVSQGLQVLIMLTILSVAPSILLLSTAFTRIVIVLSLIRQALGTPTLPPTQVLVSMALILSFFVMAPTFDKINKTAWEPYSKGAITQEAALERAVAPLRLFMFKQTNESDIGLFMKLAKLNKASTTNDVPTHVLLPAFIISELKTAFQLGFVIFLPFLIIDLVVSSILVSMGMMFLPPASIALPFKLILFVLVDGWHLLCQALVVGFRE
jgi:flagellar biosynthetic protein FliP